MYWKLRHFLLVGFKKPWIQASSLDFSSKVSPRETKIDAWGIFIYSQNTDANIMCITKCIKYFRISQCALCMFIYVCLYDTHYQRIISLFSYTLFCFCLAILNYEKRILWGRLTFLFSIELFCRLLPCRSKAESCIVRRYVLYVTILFIKFIWLQNTFP